MATRSSPLDEISLANPAASKIEIDDQFPADPGRKLCNLGKGFLAFWILRNSCLRLLFDPEHNLEERILNEQFTP